jgi:molybdopterin synthase catalytic subunit
MVMPNSTIRIQTDNFDVGLEYNLLSNQGQSGAVVTFVGLVRDYLKEEHVCDLTRVKLVNSDNTISAPHLWLEHYPGMTEKILAELIENACKLWQLHSITIIHRVGRLDIGEQIVFIGVSASHRKDAFCACEYLIDFLKTQAPIWKREGSDWVTAKDSDAAQQDLWQFGLKSR